MKYIDPTGKDWFEANGDYKWLDHSEDSYIDENDKIWKNIGSDFSLVIGYDEWGGEITLELGQKKNKNGKWKPTAKYVTYGRHLSQDPGSIQNVNIEFAFLTALSQVGTKALINVGSYLLKLMNNAGSTTNTFDAGKNGFASGNVEKMGRSRGNMSRNHEVQNEQVISLAKKHDLTPREKDILHREISKQGYGYHEIEQLIKEMFNK